MWTKLQEVLSSVEDSISSKRSWAAPITASDRAKHREHLRAAQESWVKASQVFTFSQFLYVFRFFFNCCTCQRNQSGIKLKGFLCSQRDAILFISR